MQEREASCQRKLGHQTWGRQGRLWLLEVAQVLSLLSGWRSSLWRGLAVLLSGEGTEGRLEDRGGHCYCFWSLDSLLLSRWN